MSDFRIVDPADYMRQCRQQRENLFAKGIEAIEGREPTPEKVCAYGRIVIGPDGSESHVWRGELLLSTRIQDGIVHIHYYGPKLAGEGR